MVDSNLKMFEDQSLDHIYIGHRIENLSDPKKLLQEASHKLKVGGHLVVSTSVGNHSAGVIELYPKLLKEWIGMFGRWQLKVEMEQEGKSLLVMKRLDGKKGVLPLKPKSDRKTACIARYGALGDAIIMSPLVRQLSEDGYDVTLNITTYCTTIFENNPYVSNVVVQERDAIPNPELGKYWAYWKPRYDRYINLSESLEGDLLQVEGRKTFFTHKDWRHQQCNKNYYDYTLMKGGYPEVTGKRGEMFFTRAEERRAQEFFKDVQDKFIVLWSLNGSSHHKVFPLMEPCMRKFLSEHPDSRLITVGDYTAKLMEFEHPQVLQKAGEWKVRESLIATQYVDLVVGPETMMTNAAGCYSTPKITFLSHSSHENLCKYWENDYCLEPDIELAPCYPCHQLHYTKESCPINTMVDKTTNQEIARGPRCAMGGISAQRFLDRIEEVYNRWRK